MAQDESPTIQVEETQYDANKEPYVQASQPDPKNKESPPTAQKPKTPGQLMTPATPRTRAEPAQTSPLGPAPSLPSQYPVPQSPSQESDNGSSENSVDGPEEEHREKEKVDPHVLPQFDWEGLETEYYAAMSKANDVEGKLNEEFRALANVRTSLRLIYHCTFLTNLIVLRSMVQYVACKRRGEGCETVQDEATACVSLGRQVCEEERTP